MRYFLNIQNIVGRYSHRHGKWVIIMAVLVSMVIVTAAIFADRSNRSGHMSDAKASQAALAAIARALKAYRDDTKSYPLETGPVTPELFGGARNRYMNYTPKNNAGDRFDYNISAPFYYRPYVICDPRKFDGEALNLNTTNGSPAVRGRRYYICYAPAFGMFAN